MIEHHRRILIVDDNQAIHDDVRKILRGRGCDRVADLESELFGTQKRAPSVAYETASALQGADGVELVRRARAEGRPFAVALVDMRMPPGLDGLQTIERMWQIDSELQVVICTAFSDASWDDVVDRLGTTDRLLILKKPFDPAEVSQIALALTEKWRLGRQALARMTELSQSRAELEASLALARAVQEATADGLMVISRDGKIATVNRKFTEIWQLPAQALVRLDGIDLVRSLMDRLVEPDVVLTRFQNYVANPDAVGNDEIRLKDGRILERWTGPVRSETGVIHGRLLWYRDITERRRFELDRAVVTERMVAMGRLAAGVGHEIKNPLTYALGNVEGLLASGASGGVTLSSEQREQLQEARDGLARIKVIVNDLQSLARADESIGEVDLRQVLDQAIQIAGAELRPRASLLRRYEPVPPVIGSRIRLGQVFLNLIINAAQAMPEGQAAHNRIEVVLRDTGAATVIEIIDTGVGIPAENLERIFDPFFTTKEVGSGTGLGLAISRDIVTSHHGTLTARSTPGQGTTMTVAFPHSDRIAPAAAPTAEAAPIARKARVLVIDDEPLIARILQRGLSRHQVTVASQARDALARLSRGETFDVILCDLMMPDISGIDLHEQLVRDQPAIAEQMVFMTGGAFTAKAKQFLSEVPNERIDKPFSLAQVNQLIDRRLGGTAGAAGASATRPQAIG